MLRSLSIRNFILIDHLDVSFKEGLTVLTGETGAGKSIILDALSILFGGRFDASMRRTVNTHNSPFSITAECDVNPQVCAFLKEHNLNYDDDDSDVPF